MLCLLVPARRPNASPVNRASPSLKRGLLYALGAHAFWGSMPLYLLLVQSVPALEFVAWRLIFTLPLCGLSTATRVLTMEAGV